MVKVGKVWHELADLAAYAGALMAVMAGALVATPPPVWLAHMALTASTTCLEAL